MVEKFQATDLQLVWLGGDKMFKLKIFDDEAKKEAIRKKMVDYIDVISSKSICFRCVNGGEVNILKPLISLESNPHLSPDVYTTIRYLVCLILPNHEIVTRLNALRDPIVKCPFYSERKTTVAPATCGGTET